MSVTDKRCALDHGPVLSPPLPRRSTIRDALSEKFSDLQDVYKVLVGPTR